MFIPSISEREFLPLETESKTLLLVQALRATLFAAVGTAGQRCTTLRRLYLHQNIKAEFIEKLTKAYKTVKAGNPLEDGVLLGPLHNQQVSLV